MKDTAAGEQNMCANTTTLGELHFLQGERVNIARRFLCLYQLAWRRYKGSSTCSHENKSVALISSILEIDLLFMDTSETKRRKCQHSLAANNQYNNGNSPRDIS